MKKRSRFFASLAVLLIVFVLFASLYFILHEAHHDCSGKDCPVCRLIAVCRDTLKGFAFISVLVGILLAFLFRSSAFRSAREEERFAHTPVSLKVRLLN